MKTFTTSITMGCNFPEPPKSCTVEGKPVNPILGCKILSETADVYIDAHMPLVWRRSYASDVAYEGMLGQGWSFDFGYRLELDSDEIRVYDSYGKKDIFPKLAIGESHLIPKSKLLLAHPEAGEYICQMHGREYVFEASDDGEVYLMRIQDNNDNQINFFYEASETHPRYIALDNLRLFRVQYKAQRIQSLEEIVSETPSVGDRLLALETELLHLSYTQQNQRIRLSSIQSHHLKNRDKLQETHNIYEVKQAESNILVRYAYSEQNDLVAVYGREDLLLRTFEYHNHIMVAHKVPEGLESFYEYDSYTPEGKVLKNSTNTGQSWEFHYEDEKTIVTDALGRETIYTFNPHKYITSKTDTLHQTSKMIYNNQGQLTRYIDITGNEKTFGYSSEGEMTSLDIEGETQKIRYHKQYQKPLSIEN